MAHAKRMFGERQDRDDKIQEIAIETGALELNEDTDEVGSNLDEEADRETYARVFRAWADGKISGTAEEIFQAVTDALS
jgi:hypothetical protein